MGNPLQPPLPHPGLFLFVKFSLQCSLLDSNCPGFPVPNTVFSNQGEHQALPGFPLPALQPRKFSQEVSWNNCQAQLVDFPFSGFTVLYCQMSNIGKPLFHILQLFYFFWLFKVGDISSSHYSILAESRSPKCVIVKLFFS